MSPFEVWATVIAVFFGFGIAMGVLIVVALPVFRRYREQRRYTNGDDWQEPPALDEDETKPPRWPGD